MINYLLIVVGFALLTGGANVLVNGASGLAAKMEISNLVIGLTVVALGTSAPELLVNVVAAINGNSQIAITNVLGSNSVNTLLILGVSALFYPLVAQKSTLRIEIPLSFFAALAVLILGTVQFAGKANEISRLDGVFLLLCFVGFLVYTIRLSRKSELVVSEEDIKTTTLGKAIFLVIGGLAVLAIGAEMVVRSSVKLALAWGVSESVIGVTIVALGTSLPELATSVVAAIKKNPDIAIGNIIGSNILNVFFVLGLSAVIRPLPAYPNLVADASVAALGSLLVLLFVGFGKKRTLNRWHGMVLLLVYAVYLAWIISTL